MDIDITQRLIKARQIQNQINRLVDEQTDLLKPVSDYAETASDEDVLGIYKYLPKFTVDRDIVREILKDRGLWPPKNP